MRYIMISILLLFISGCSNEPKIRTITEDRVVYKVKEVYVPVACDVNVTCEFSGEGYTPTMKLLECVVLQKRALDYCKQVPKEEGNDHN